jgi:hypothetical protein
MAKFLMNDVVVTINSVDLSDHAFSIDTPETREQVDVSGFNPNANKEFLPGAKDQTITVGFIQDGAGSKVHQTLQPLFTGGSTFPISIKSASTSPSITLSGTASLYEYNGLSGALGARAELTVAFKPANNSNWSWGTA